MGRFSIDRYNGWSVTVSAVGYKSKVVKVKADEQDLLVKLREDSKSLKEVVVRSKRGRYSRKNNPAV